MQTSQNFLGLHTPRLARDAFADASFEGSWYIVSNPVKRALRRTLWRALEQVPSGAILETFIRCFVDPDALDESAGAELLDPIQRTPVGRKMRYRHPDGLVVEYVEHAA